MDGLVHGCLDEPTVELTKLTGIGSSMGIALVEASAAGTIWSLVIAGAFTAILSAGLAELASAYPIAGAQYYWACEYTEDYQMPPVELMLPL